MSIEGQGESAVGYQSAMDLPSFREMQAQARAMRLFGFMLKREDRRNIKELQANLIKVVQEVDDFYDKLGDRHWIYHDQMPTTLVSELVSDSATADEAEMALCGYYADEKVLQRLVMGTMRFPAMRARQALVQAAQHDYQEGRYYSVVLVLLVVLDGFVNDVEAARRGLHARNPEELQSFDTAVGHHKGLTATQSSFRKGYFKRNDEETHDLARNGILHGMLTNFDNKIVASKAWNRLFAVVDWAASVEKEARPAEPKPTWGELFHKLGDNAARQKKLDSWVASSGTIVPGADYSDVPVLTAANQFLTLWHKKNWGHLAPMFTQIGKGDQSRMSPKGVKDFFEPYVLDDFTITSYEITSPAIAEIAVQAVISGKEFPLTLRMSFGSDESEMRVEGAEEGTWRMVWRSPEMFNREMVAVARHRR